jgi:mRNA interferase MazF
MREKMQGNYLNFSQGDIIISKLPYSDYSGFKLRPLLIVSNNKFNNSRKDLIVCKITGVNHNEIDNILKIEQEDLTDGILKKTSYINSNILFTIDKEIIIDNIAKLKKEKIKIIIKNIINSF